MPQTNLLVLDAEGKPHRDDYIVPVEPLGALGVARSVAAGAATAAQTLTATCTRVSLLALTNDLCFSVDGAAATSNSHYLQAGERIDIRVATGTTINAIRAGANDGVLRITELV